LVVQAIGFFGGFILRDGAARLLRMTFFFPYLAALAGRGRIAPAIRVRGYRSLQLA